mmetsp:Transcript_91672/g.268305  ORF Transcript_91672/g.268305 Transcript_91672/m.268305 type:complete len:355 (+) Transcript_91672:71-1135(+)
MPRRGLHALLLLLAWPCRGFDRKPSGRFLAHHAHRLGCPTCGPLKHVGHMPSGMSEPSGLAASLKHPGVYYVISDSPRVLQLMALRETGEIMGRFNTTGTAYPSGLEFGARGTGDLESLAVGPCEPGSSTGPCIFVGDTGQNCARRSVNAFGVRCKWYRPQGLYSLLRFQEPEQLSTAELSGERFWFRFPDDDGPYDVETLIQTPAGQFYIVAKVESGPVGVFRIPALLRDGAAVVERVATLDSPRGRAGVPGYHPASMPGKMFTDGGSLLRGGQILGVTAMTYSWVFYFPGRNGSSVEDAFRGRPCLLAEIPLGWQAEGFCWGRGDDWNSFLVVGENTHEIMKAQCALDSQGW